MSSDHRYSQEEVNAILKRALERDRGSTGEAVSHQDLLDTAREVGIDASQVEEAIVEVKREQQALAVRDAWIERRKERWRRMALTWAFVSLLCLIINVLAPGPWWCQWVFAPWGTVVLFQYLRSQRPPTGRELSRMHRRLERERRKRELEVRFERGAHALGSVVEQGANLLLAHLDERARRLEAGRREDLPPDPRRPRR